MKSSDIIATALANALSNRPLSYTTAGLAATVAAALKRHGFAIVPVVPTEAMLQGGCAKHRPGQPMSSTTPSWRGTEYDSAEECPAFVERRRIYRDMIERAGAGQ